MVGRKSLLLLSEPQFKDLYGHSFSMMVGSSFKTLSDSNKNFNKILKNETVSENEKLRALILFYFIFLVCFFFNI